MQDNLTGRHAVRVYTLDGTVRIRVPRGVALRKLEDGDVIYAC